MAMMLLAESGATKTEWRMLDRNRVVRAFRTAGFNPNVQTFEAIVAQIDAEIRPVVGGLNIAHIHFYGAGFSTPSFCAQMEAALATLVEEVTVCVEHDLLGAARSVAADSPAIVCILGTGSNSCVYDGRSIVRQLGGHGYLFGDEGSGADIGKRILKALLDEEMSPEVLDAYVRQMGETPLRTKNRIYAEAKPNVALARLTYFAEALAEHPDVHGHIFTSLQQFLLTTVMRYPEFGTLPVSFVGSVAEVFWPTLSLLCDHYGVQVNAVERYPIDGLVRYHQTHAPHRI